jgi:hypothetical protein
MAAAAGLLVAGCFGHVVYPSEPIQGRVVDAETGQPLAGAAVVLVWYREGPGPGHPTEAVHDAREVLTGANGDFTIPEQTHVVFVGQVNRPYVIVYAPGYRDFLGQEGSGPFARGASPALVKLARAVGDERRWAADMPSLVGAVPSSKIPNLIRLVNEARRAVGLQPVRVKE